MELTGSLRDIVEHLSRLLLRDGDRSLSHALVLRTIATRATRLSEVAQHISHHPSTASRIVDQLVDDGLVHRDVDPDDRRALHLRLTTAGDRELARLRAGLADFLDRVVDDLGPDEAATVAAALEQFVTTAAAVLAADGFADHRATGP